MTRRNESSAAARLAIKISMMVLCSMMLVLFPLATEACSRSCLPFRGKSKRVVVTDVKNDDASKTELPIPFSFLCSISQSLHIWPGSVVTSDGYTYRTESITQWCKRCKASDPCRSPMTTEELKDEAFPNFALTRIIEKWPEIYAAIQRRELHPDIAQWREKMSEEEKKGLFVCADGLTHEATITDTTNEILQNCYRNLSLEHVIQEIKSVVEGTGGDNEKQAEKTTLMLRQPPTFTETEFFEIAAEPLKPSQPPVRLESKTVSPRSAPSSKHSSSSKWCSKVFRGALCGGCVCRSGHEGVVVADDDGDAATSR